MPDGKITFSTALDNKPLEKDLSDINGKIKKAEDNLTKKKDEQSNIKRKLDEAQKAAEVTERSIQKLKDEYDSLDVIRGNYTGKEMLDPRMVTDGYWGAKERQEEITAEIEQQNKTLNKQNADAQELGLQYTRVFDNIKNASEELAAMQEEAGRLVEQVNSAGSGTDWIDDSAERSAVALERVQKEAAKAAEQLDNAGGNANQMGIAMKKAGSYMDKFLNRVKKLAGRVFVFSVITRGLRAMLNWMGKVIKANDEAAAAIADLKGALLTMAQPVINVVIPAFTFLVNLLTRIITVVSKLFSKLFGLSYDSAKKSAEALNEETNGIKGVGKAAKDASKYLAGFDELNVMQDNTPSGGVGLPTDQEAGASFDFDTSPIKAKLDEIAVYVGGALLTVGAILAFTGANVPLGIGLMAVGAAVLAAEIAENWSAMDDGMTTAIASVMLILGGASLIIGAVLAFSGANIPLGIGLMLLGAASLSAAAVLNWEAISEALQGPIGGITAILGGALLVIGAVLAFSGANLPLGIGLIAVGAIALATTAALNWNTIVEALKGPTGIVTAIVSAALLAIGAILTFSGVGLPLGIGLMLAGAAGLAVTAAVNWDTIVSALRGPVGKITAMVSGALLVLGIILVVTGVGIPLGIGLIIAGAAGLVTVTALNWNTIIEKIKGVWNGIKNWWSTKIAPIFTIAWWKDKFSSISDGLKAKIKDGVNASIGLFNKFIDWINKKLNISWGSFSIAGVEIIPSGSVQLLEIPSIPMLAKGAVIPPNREFMAVLGDQKHGTNIEAPLETIQEAVAVVIDDMISSNMAGHEATVAVLREILEAVLGIRIGDEEITQAFIRNQRKQSIINGGVL